MPFTLPRRALPAMLACCSLLAAGRARADLPKVPEGFEARLVATVPAVIYPCQIATAPDGALYVAEDPMDQVGPYEAKDGRILLFRDGKDPVRFADGFRAIFGMAWYEGALYVNHMPYLTVLRDTDGDGRADEREDLFRNLGPTDNRGLNDHIVSGIQFGMDGYLYIAVGDKGIPRATGPDWRSIQMFAGGICRCRPDGTGLEVVTNGTRNHLEPNLNDRDDLFTYDNTDDGLGWWTRVTHHVDGGYYGYPYDYHDRPDRMLPRMAEYGGGSPCGALVYKEDAWPERYRNVGFWAEWGKGKVHAFRFAPDGSTYKIAEEINFALPDKLNNFRPIDLALSYDGRTLYVADWNMGGWGKKDEKVGRIFAVTYKGEVKTRPRGKDSDPIDAQIRQLDHPSFNERMRAQRALIRAGSRAIGAVRAALADAKTDALARRHLVWTLDGLAGGTAEATAPLVEALRSPVADVRAQAARALGERKVADARKPLEALLDDRELPVRLQAVIALGRIGDAAAIPALLPQLAECDRFIAFSARRALRRIGDWKAAARGLDSSDPKVRGGVLAAMELVYEADAARALAGFAADPARPVDERAEALMYLAQGHRKTKPWDGRWFGTRPAASPPPAKVVDWEGTPLVLETVRAGLADPKAPIRVAAVSAVKETADRDALGTLRARFDAEPDADVRRLIAQTLGALGDTDALPRLIAALRDAKTPDPVREAALGAVETIGTDVSIRALVDVLDDPGLADERRPRVIGALGKFKAKEAVKPIVAALRSPAPAVRSAAAEALGKIGQLQGADRPLRILLDDPATDVRKSAIGALGALKDREAVPALIALAEKEETRFEATRALAAIPDLSALRIYLRGLGDKNADVRKDSAAALSAIRGEAVPVLDQLAARKELPPSLVSELVKVYAAWQPLTDWRVLGPFPMTENPVNPEGTIDVGSPVVVGGRTLEWKLVKPADEQGQINLGQALSNSDNVAALGYAEVQMPEEKPGQLRVGSDDTLTVWINGKQVYDAQGSRGFKADQDTREVKLAKGTNRIVIKCGNHGGGWQYAVALAAAQDYAFLKAPKAGAFNPDEYRAFAVKHQGRPERGRALFADPKGLACIKCHAVGKEGGAVGPELTSVGAKYQREELIESVLYPSAKIFSGYEPSVIALSDGRVVTGIVKGETPEAIELQDADAKLVRIAKDDVEERKRSDVSLMPNGLAEGLTKEDFADLISYLQTLKEVPAKPASASGAGGR